MAQDSKATGLSTMRARISRTKDALKLGCSAPLVTGGMVVDDGNPLRDGPISGEFRHKQTTGLCILH